MSGRQLREIPNFAARDCEREERTAYDAKEIIRRCRRFTQIRIRTTHHLSYTYLYVFFHTGHEVLVEGPKKVKNTFL